MAAIKITQFGGEYPSTLARNLPAEAAQVAENIQATTLEFRPLADDATVATVGNANPGSLYRTSRNTDGTLNLNPSLGWQTTVKPVNRVRSQIDDSFEADSERKPTDRTYYTVADGSEPPRVSDVLGNNRLLGVPAPTTAPTATVSENYTFTPELRITEVAAALKEAVDGVIKNATKVSIGVSRGVVVPGWVSIGDYALPGDTQFDQDMWRVFAVNPDTDALINTYSAIRVEEAGWVFDPALGGARVRITAGQPSPSWANGHKEFWAIRMRAFGDALDINEAAATAALLAIKKPGTDGAQTWLDAEQAEDIVDRLMKAGDKDEPYVKGLADKLVTAQNSLATILNGGGTSPAVYAVRDFYQRTDVKQAIEDAERTYADYVWGILSTVATTVAVTPITIPPEMGGDGG